jgi:hypothetical protein
MQESRLLSPSLLGASNRSSIVSEDENGTWGNGSHDIFSILKHCDFSSASACVLCSLR